MTHLAIIIIVPFNILNIHMLDGGFTPVEVTYIESESVEIKPSTEVINILVSAQARIKALIGLQHANESQDKKVEEKKMISPETINDMVIDHQHLIWKGVMRYRGTHDLSHDLSEEDLFQSGVIGVINAAKKFEPERGKQFSKFAIYDIKKSIRTSIIEGGRNIRVPADAFTYRGQIVSCEGKAGKELTIQELHEMTGICTTTLRNVRKNTKILMKPIDRKKEDINGDPLLTLSETLPNEKSPNPEEESIANERIAIARAIMTELEKEDPKANKVLKMRFGFEDGVEMDNAEIGKKLGVTREAIRVKGKKGLKKLRAMHNIITYTKKMGFEAR